jgi:ankyrin repeat protein
MSQPAADRPRAANGYGATPPSMGPQPQPVESMNANRQRAPAVHAQAAYPTALTVDIPELNDEDRSVRVRVECSLTWANGLEAESAQADANAAHRAGSRKRKAESDLPRESPPQKPMRWPLAQMQQAAPGDVLADLPPLVTITPAARDGDEALRARLAELHRYGFTVAESNAGELALRISSRHPGGPRVTILMSRERVMQALDPVELIESMLNSALSQSSLVMADILASHGWHPSVDWARDADLIRRAATECRGHLLQALLCRGADIVTPDHDGKTVLHHAVEAGASEMLELLANPETINHADNNGNTPLLAAIRRGNSLDSCVALVRMGANLEIRGRNRDTALHCAIRLQRTLEIAVLLRAGADPNARDGSGNTPLHLACRQGNNTVVLQLLSVNCDTRLRDERGRRAFDLVTDQGVEQSTFELLRFLTPLEAQEWQEG